MKLLWLIPIIVMLLAGCSAPSPLIAKQDETTVGSFIDQTYTATTSTAAHPQPTTQESAQLHLAAPKAKAALTDLSNKFDWYVAFWNEWHYTWLGVRAWGAIRTVIIVGIVGLIGWFVLNYYSAGLAGTIWESIMIVVGHVATGGTVFIGKALNWTMGKLTDLFAWLVVKLNTPKASASSAPSESTLTA